MLLVRNQAKKDSHIRYRNVCWPCVSYCCVDAYLKCFNVIVDSVDGSDNGGGGSGGVDDDSLPVNTTIVW